MHARPALRLLCLLSLAAALPATAQNAETPYWASLAAEEVNMRVGPSTAYPIEWVYARPGLPVKVVRVNEGWRYVEDPDGTTGWMAARLLTRNRGAIVIGEETVPMRAEPSPEAALRWQLEPGVVGLLGDCREGWCELDIHGHRGWVAESDIWGDGEP